MKLLRAIFEEIWGMFVDDGSLAILSLVLVIGVGIAVKLAGLPPQWSGYIIGVGCLLILASSVHRAASRR